MNANTVRKLIRDECRKLGGEAEFARAVGVSRQLVNAMVTGRQEPAGKILAYLGIEVVKIRDYRRVGGGTKS